ncbi:hypothetical protein, partial [Brevibacillus laterosporus]|uniref:hypothetical protein n=1 Tax=Brevibacillus laterosporus TaxID=1465 RepID=UPI003D1A3B85
DFKDEKTGNSITGCKIRYLDFSKVSDDNADLMGIEPSEETIAYSRFHELPAVGFYTVTLGIDMSGRKSKVVFEKCELDYPFDFADFYQSNFSQSMK